MRSEWKSIVANSKRLRQQQRNKENLVCLKGIIEELMEDEVDLDEVTFGKDLIDELAKLHQMLMVLK